MKASYKERILFKEKLFKKVRCGLGRILEYSTPIKSYTCFIEYTFYETL